MKRAMAVVGILVMLAGAYVYGEQAGERRAEGGRVRQGDEGDAGWQKGLRHGPPPEAYTACEGKAEGSAAQFTDPKGEVVSGKCEIADGKLVLRPDHPKGGGSRDGRQGPPPEAYQACEGKKAGAVSQLTDPRGEVLKGVCEEENGKMVLRPERNRSDGQGKAQTAGGQASPR